MKNDFFKNCIYVFYARNAYNFSNDNSLLQTICDLKTFTSVMHLMMNE